MKTEKFKSEQIYFTSDTHFAHENIIKYCNRPFETLEEHDEELIKRWNEKVSKDSIVFHLGDFGFGDSKYLKQIISRLNGKIYLIIGNHDWRSVVRDCSSCFEEVHQQMNIKIDNKHIILNHYPMLCFSGAWRGLDASWQLFGHVHTSPYTDAGLDHERLKHLFTTQYDVGVDNNDFAPISFKDVAQIIENQQMSLGMCRNKL